MHHDKSKVPRVQVSFVIYILLLISLFYLLVSKGHSGLLFLILLFSSFSLSTMFLLTTRTFLPETTVGQILQILKLSLIHSLSTKPLIYKIRNGEINGDYFLLKIKPRINLLWIDRQSAALIVVDGKKLGIRFSGFYVFSKPVTIFCTLFTSTRRVVFGPDSQSALSAIGSGERISNHHARIRSGIRTQSITKDGITVFPNFEIIYRIDTQKNHEELIKILKSLPGFQSPSGSKESLEIIENYLLQITLLEWKRLIAELTHAQVLNKIPFIIHTQNLFNNGLIFKIYVPTILTDGIEKLNHK